MSRKVLLIANLPGIVCWCTVPLRTRNELIGVLYLGSRLEDAFTVSREFQDAYREIHELVLARSSSGKLARLLLSWVRGREGAAREVRVQTSAPHEEMAQRVDASRETVTRLLSKLRKKDLIRLDDSTRVKEPDSARSDVSVS